jgi:hypothetical protein
LNCRELVSLDDGLFFLDGEIQFLYYSLEHQVKIHFPEDHHLLLQLRVGQEITDQVFHSTGGSPHALDRLEP